MDIDAGLIEEVALTLGTTPQRAAEIIRAAQPLWQALEPHVDAYGGAEFDRVFPEAIALINRLANEVLT